MPRRPLPDHPLLLVTDSRWPLDADGAMVAHTLQAAALDRVTALRVPDDATAYRFVPPGDGLVVIVADEKTVPVAPPAGWKHPVCWHVADGCLTGWNGGTQTESIATFVSAATSSVPSIPQTASTYTWLLLPAALVLLVVGRSMLRRWLVR